MRCRAGGDGDVLAARTGDGGLDRAARDHGGHRAAVRSEARTSEIGALQLPRQRQRPR